MKGGGGAAPKRLSAPRKMLRTGPTSLRAFGSYSCSTMPANCRGGSSGCRWSLTGDFGMRIAQPKRGNRGPVKVVAFACHEKANKRIHGLLQKLINRYVSGCPEFSPFELLIRCREENPSTSNISGNNWHGMRGGTSDSAYKSGRRVFKMVDKARDRGRRGL